jgi:hypothetical protein
MKHKPFFLKIKYLRTFTKNILSLIYNENKTSADYAHSGGQNKENVLLEPLKVVRGTPGFQGTQSEYHCHRPTNKSLANGKPSSSLSSLALQLF